MKKLTLFSLVFLLSMPLMAQLIQNGLVREMNSNRRPIADVQISFEDAVPTDSDVDGNFRLAFDDTKKQIADLIFLKEIKKNGYELVNRKDFDIVKISKTDQLGVDIILAETGTVDAAKKEYYKVSDEALLAGFEREKAAIRKQLKAAELNQQEYQNQLTSLQEKYDRQKESLDALAERFARLNFDDVTPIYEAALKLFKNGKIDEAIVKLESSNPTLRTAQIIREEKRLSNAQADFDKQKAALAKEKAEQIAAVRLLADMYSLQFNPQKAELQYDQLLQLDSTDLTILREAASFYQKNHLYEKAQAVYPGIIQHSEAADWQVANAYGHRGDIFMQTGSLSDALEAYTNFFNAYQKLVKENPNSSFYKSNLAISYSKLGFTYTFLGNLDSALTFYQNQNQLEKELYEDFSQNVEFKNVLAISYERLGETHSALGNLDTALTFHQDETELFEELYGDYPQNVEFKNGLAISYQYLGITHNPLWAIWTAL